MRDINLDWITVVAFLVAVVACGRAARLLVFDDFPPTRAVREWYIGHVKGKWSGLFECPFCLAPYLVAGDLAWYLLADDWVLAAWWIVNIWAANSYLAAILVSYDQPE